MPRPSRLSKEAFERLLQWLGPDPEDAGTRYQEAHHRLVKLFGFKGCDCPEDLADEVIDRVAQKLLSGELPPQRPEDWTKSFYAFVKFVHLEYVKGSWRDKCMVSVTAPPEDFNVEHQHRCLYKCLSRLSEDDRKLLLEYHRYERGQKIQHRRLIAHLRHSSTNALRIRVCRLRATLAECMVHCLQSGDLSSVQQ